MPYVFSETASGCVITHTKDARLRVSLTLHDTAIAVESDTSSLCQTFGLFDYYALARWTVRRLLQRQINLDTPRRKEEWLLRVTGRSIGKALHRQWKRYR